MSFDNLLLNTKKGVSKDLSSAKGLSNTSPNSAKSSPSLFDSLLSEVKKDADMPGQKSSKTAGGSKEKSAQPQSRLQEKAVVNSKETEIKGGDENSKKVSSKLADLVVKGAKADKKTGEEKNKAEDKKTESNPISGKSKVSKKVDGETPLKDIKENKTSVQTDTAATKEVPRKTTTEDTKIDTESKNDKVESAKREDINEKSVETKVLKKDFEGKTPTKESKVKNLLDDNISKKEPKQSNIKPSDEIKEKELKNTETGKEKILDSGNFVKSESKEKTEEDVLKPTAKNIPEKTVESKKENISKAESSKKTDNPSEVKSRGESVSQAGENGLSDDIKTAIEAFDKEQSKNSNIKDDKVESHKEVKKEKIHEGKKEEGKTQDGEISEVKVESLDDPELLKSEKPENKKETKGEDKTLSLKKQENKNEPSFKEKGEELSPIVKKEAESLKKEEKRGIGKETAHKADKDIVQKNNKESTDIGNIKKTEEPKKKLDSEKTEKDENKKLKSDDVDSIQTIKGDDSKNLFKDFEPQNISRVDLIKPNQKNFRGDIESPVKQVLDETPKTKEPLLASMFLSSQKKLKEMVSKEQLHAAKKNIENSKSIESVKDSAKMLDLNMDEDEIGIETTKEEGKAPLVESKEKYNEKKEFAINSGSKRLDKMFLNQSLGQKAMGNELPLNNNINNNFYTQAENETAQVVKESAAESVQKSQGTNGKETVLNLNVPSNVVETIQNKIIGAQQKMGSFMSDLARNLYLNYKPPMTAFRISLNPASLGSISIVMRNNKSDNSLSVSMNMSNSSTMDAFADNKATLQNALQRTLNDGSNVSLDFGMQGGDPGSSFGEQASGQNSSGNDRNDQAFSSEKETDNEVAQDKDLSYM